MEKLTAWINGGRGRLTEVAKACRITHSAVSQWDRVPSDHVRTVEKVTGISRVELRPDLYGELEEASR
ncbi:helix-turn-helix domain-containing protein [Mesorhizobium sp. M0050]|uniref:transcriptional regulator n=1 Tax=unclassified Mesorhizobium TaxID=325217 RepID=UPI0003CFB47C|nr:MULTISPECIES: YdaS family helix-turn-helix protein [unclassified Mesorhizobium]ESZ60509.1 hypothetical protein X728_15235 [Mesorhizobium sp. L103C120A0]WJI43728.1 helix-turn-helix domain-containing protein [Mesorhizobium sp. C120A]